ncbi:MAG TPA: GNAT family N-acetyltransferase [Gemmatimonadales bacterium]|nr:GNAT family N-acetyltransferase [Gemmatimonadales bacterium]
MPPIRDAAWDDLPRVAAINTAAAPGVSVLTLNELEDLWHRASVFWVAGDTNEAAAYLFGFTATAEYDGEEFGWFRARETGFLHIDQVAVAVWARRAGLGRALYAHAARSAQERALTRLTCGVNLRPPNPESLRFHVAVGFHEVGRLETREGCLVSLRERLVDGAA